MLRVLLRILAPLLALAGAGLLLRDRRPVEAVAEAVVRAPRSTVWALQSDVDG